jgi:small conductance mechanosensitive channel
MNDFFSHLHPERWTTLWSALSDYGMRFCIAALILGFGWWFSRRVGRALYGLLDDQSRIDMMLRPILCGASVLAIRVVAAIGALLQFGIETASLIAVLGAAGLAIGLALRGTMQNIAAGIMLLMLRPFRVGDYIEDGGNVAGTVDEIGLFATRLTKPDGICEYVPNSALWSNSLRNYSRHPTRRLDLEAPVSLHDDVGKAITALKALARHEQLALQDPPPQVMVMRFEDSVAVLNLRVWTKTESFWDMRRKLSGEIRRTLDEANCKPPVQMRELHVVQGASNAEKEPGATEADESAAQAHRPQRSSAA